MLDFVKDIFPPSDIPEDQDVCCEIASSVYDRGAALTKSKRIGHLHKTRTMTAAPVDKPKAMPSL